MNSNSTSRMPMPAGVGLALAACLLLLPAPVHADTLNATEDTYVNENKPGKKFGSRTSIKVKAGSDLWGFAKFDLSVLGDIGSEDVDKATLRLWIRKVRSAGEIEVCRVTGAWSEGGLNWFMAQLLTLTPCKAPVGIAKADEGTWVLVDVTDFVKDWLDGTPNDGIALLAVGTNIQLDSKEDKKTSHPMEIEVTHNPSAVIDVAVNTPPSSGVHPHTVPCTLDGDCTQHPHADVTVATGAHPHTDPCELGDECTDHPHADVTVATGNHPHTDPCELGDECTDHPHADVTVATGNHPHGPIFKDYEFITVTPTTEVASAKFTEALCTTGKTVIGGGCSLAFGVFNSPDLNKINLGLSAPRSGDNAWACRAHTAPTHSGAKWALIAIVICAIVP